MVYVLNLVVSLFLPGLLESWRKWNTEAAPLKQLDPQESARALAALAGILILGLGAVLMIGLGGRWFRRLVFPKSGSKKNSGFDSGTTAIPHWAKPESGSNDSLDEPASSDG